METAADQPRDPSWSTAEDSGVGQRSAKKFRVAKRTFAEATVASPSFVDVPMGGEEVEGDWVLSDPEVESDGEMEEEELREGILVVQFPKSVRADLCKAWKKALIIKFLGKTVAFSPFQQRFLRLWNLRGKSEMLDVGSGCYVVRFELSKDFSHVLLDGPWKIFDHYVVVQRWQPEFDPKDLSITKMPVWVRLPGLQVEYFREDAIKLILEKVGTPLKLDTRTLAVERGRFARAAVEIDTSKPLIAKVWIRNRVQIIEYEGLHTICFGFGSVGHRLGDCPHRSEVVQTVESNSNEVVDTQEPMLDANPAPSASAPTR